MYKKIVRDMQERPGEMSSPYAFPDREPEEGEALVNALQRAIRTVVGPLIERGENVTEREATRRAYADLLALIQQKPGQDRYTFSFPNATAEEADALRKAGQYVAINMGVQVTLRIAGVTYKE